MAKNSQPKNIFVKGMHCSSCELLIEKTIRDYPGVKKVSASLDKGEVQIWSDKDDIDIYSLNHEFKQAGYEFSKEQFTLEKNKLFEITDGHLEINKSRAFEYIKILGVVLLVFVVVGLVNNSSIGKYAGIDSNSSLPAFLILGVVAGLSSCAALVGSLLLVMTKQWNDLYITDKTNRLKFQPHLLFHTGRLAGFFLFGGVLGLLGQAVAIGNGSSFAVLIIAVSLVMLILALQMIGIRKFQRVKLKTPKAISNFITDKTNFSGKYAPFILGALTFLLPCGFTLVAQATALASAGFVRGGLVMLFFALGTFPILAGISFAGVRFNAKPALTSLFNKIAGILIVVFSVYTINSQLNVLGLKSLSDIPLSQYISPGNLSDEMLPEGLEVEEDTQKIVIIADDFSYRPNGSTTVEAGKPTVLAVNNKGVQGCGRFMAAKGLFDKYVELKTGWNYVEFTPKKGVYKLSCTMGMVPPVTIKVI